MAEKKFSELTAKGATVADTDLFAIAESDGGKYNSKSVTGANIKALVTDTNLTTTDVTTNDVSTSKHGFVPKAPNDKAKVLRGDGTWATDTNFKWTLDFSGTTLTTDIYLNKSCAIASVTNLLNSPTTTLQLNGSAYTLGNAIVSGDKITVTVSTASVIDLNFTV